MMKNRSSFLVFLAAVALILGSLIPIPIATASASSSVPCQNGHLTFIGVRGSGEKQSNNAGYGPTVEAIRARVRARVPSDTQLPINYTAISVNSAALTLTVGYDASVVDGVGKLQKAVTDILSTCPNAWIVIAGYSQGADVAGDVFERFLTAGQLDRVLGVVLVGDPRFQGVQSDIDVGSYDSNLNGVYTHFRQAKRLDNYPSKTLSLCTAHDPICNWTTGNALGCMFTCSHKQYMTIKYLGMTYTDRAANFLVDRYLRAISPPAKNAHVLIYGDNDNWPGTTGSTGNIANVLTAAGYAVTNLAPQDVLPVDLRAFGQIWHVGAYSAISNADIGALTNFAESGGGLYLTGERPCCAALNASDATILNALIVTVGGIGVGDGNDHDSQTQINLDTVIPRSVIDQPYALPNFQPEAPGALTNIADRNVLYRSLDGSAVAGVWSADDVIGGGRVAVLMDINWAETLSSEMPLLTENLALFLGGSLTPPNRVAPVPAVTAAVKTTRSPWGLFARNRAFGNTAQRTTTGGRD